MHGTHFKMARKSAKHVTYKPGFIGFDYLHRNCSPNGTGKLLVENYKKEFRYLKKLISEQSVHIRAF